MPEILEYMPKMNRGKFRNEKYYVIACLVTIFFEAIFLYAILWVQYKAHVTAIDEGHPVEFFTGTKIQDIGKNISLIMTVPEVYRCKHSQLLSNKPQWDSESDRLINVISPCSQNREIPCYIARSQEKTTFIFYRRNHKNGHIFFGKLQIFQILQIVLMSGVGLLLIICEFFNRIFELLTLKHKKLDKNEIGKKRLKNVVGLCTEKEILTEIKSSGFQFFKTILLRFFYL